MNVLSSDGVDMAKQPEIGQLAPNVALEGVLLGEDGVSRRTFDLSAERGALVVLAFYPGDETPVCTKQMCSYATEFDKFRGLGAQVWGINFGDVASHERFATKHDLRFPLLADIGREVAKAYGITLPGLGLRRSIFIVDGEGVVRWKHVSLVGATYQSTDTLVEQLTLLGAA
jgi:peroxiredoxin Q/BCP